MTDKQDETKPPFAILNISEQTIFTNFGTFDAIQLRTAAQYEQHIGAIAALCNLPYRRVYTAFCEVASHYEHPSMVTLRELYAHLSSGMDTTLTRDFHAEQAKTEEL